MAGVGGHTGRWGRDPSTALPGPSAEQSKGLSLGQGSAPVTARGRCPELLSTRRYPHVVAAAAGQALHPEKQLGLLCHEARDG